RLHIPATPRASRCARRYFVQRHSLARDQNKYAHARGAKIFCDFLVKGARRCLYYYCKQKSELILRCSTTKKIKRKTTKRRRPEPKSCPRRKKCFPERANSPNRICPRPN